MLSLSLSLLEKSVESAAIQKNGDLQENILPKVTQTHTQTHRQHHTDNVLQAVSLLWKLVLLYCCDVFVVVDVAVYLVEHMDTNDL